MLQRIGFASLCAIVAGIACTIALAQSGTTVLTPIYGLGQSSEHACAKTADRLYCWGRNTRGQLGDGSVNDRSVAAPVVGLPVSWGFDLGGYTSGALANPQIRYAHTCAMVQLSTSFEYSVNCWGGNESGQLGDGTTIDRLFPVEVAGLPTNVRQIAAGGRHTCALLGDGTVRCWGLNDAGQLGNGTTISSSAPVTVAGLSNAFSIAAGYKHTCAVMEHGVKCWGLNNTGQLGDGTKIDRLTPVDVVALPNTAFTNLLAGGGEKDVYGNEAGSETCVANFVQPEVFCWGHNTLTPTRRGTDVPYMTARQGNAAGPPGCSGSTCMQRYSRSCGVRPSDGKAVCMDFLDDMLYRTGTLSASNVYAVSTGEGFSACAAVDGVRPFRPNPGPNPYPNGRSVVCYSATLDSFEASSTTIMTTASGLNPQSISFGDPAPTTIANVGDSLVLTINAGGSGNPVTLASTTPAICSVSGNTVTGLAQGKCIITADQAGNSQFEVAPQATLTLRVGDPLAQTITFGAAPAVVVGGSGTVSATATSGLPVTFQSITSATCSVSGTVVIGVAAGTCTVAANQAGDFFYAPAPQNMQSFTIGTGPAAAHSLSVTVTGGASSVTSSPAGIDCDAVACVASFAAGTSVTLTAHMAAGGTTGGEIFAGWTGDCSGFTCALAMDANKSVTQTFVAYTGTLKQRMRLYSPATFEHLYTSNPLEYAYLSNQIDPNCCGWQREGVVYDLMDGPAQVGTVQAVPLRRLYNPSSHQHHWTTELTEYNFLGSVGWQQEGIDQYILPTQAPGTIALYRLYNSSNGGLHLWTTDAAEAAYLTANAGWSNEGVAGYVIPLQQP